MRNFPRPLIVRVSWSPAPGETRFGHRRIPRHTPEMHPSGYAWEGSRSRPSMTLELPAPVMKGRSRRLRSRLVLCEAALAPAVVLLLSGRGYFSGPRPGRIDRALLTRSSRIQLDRPRFADDRKTRRSRKTPRDGTSSMAPRRQNSPALQGPCARARRPDEPEPLADASKFEPRQWHLQPDPGVGGTTRRHPRREVPT